MSWNCFILTIVGMVVHLVVFYIINFNAYSSIFIALTAVF